MVGGASPEGDWRDVLRQRVIELGLEDCVIFLGALPPHALKVPLSAADVFVLATRNEGWANVFLEAMACGLPVVATDVGGNREVVANAELGVVVPFGDRDALAAAMKEAMQHDWKRDAIVAYADTNDWDRRVAVLVEEFAGIVDRSARAHLQDRAVHCA